MLHVVPSIQEVWVTARTARAWNSLSSIAACALSHMHEKEAYEQFCFVWLHLCQGSGGSNAQAIVQIRRLAELIQVFAGVMPLRLSTTFRSLCCLDAMLCGMLLSYGMKILRPATWFCVL
jgi:hypothetical protein